MAKFYVLQDTDGYSFDCSLVKGEAFTMLRAAGGGKIIEIDAPVNKETIAKLLGNIGGYAKSVKETIVHSKERN
jgi:hypothetical protein